MSIQQFVVDECKTIWSRRITPASLHIVLFLYFSILKSTLHKFFEFVKLLFRLFQFSQHTSAVTTSNSVQHKVLKTLFHTYVPYMIYVGERSGVLSKEMYCHQSLCSLQKCKALKTLIAKNQPRLKFLSFNLLDLWLCYQQNGYTSATLENDCET